MEKKSLKELQKLVLENKTVKIKPIVRKKAYFKDGHDGQHTYTGCYRTHTLGYDADKRAYINPFRERADVDEQEAFEVLLDQKPGSLNLYKYKVNEPNFWGEFGFRVSKEGEELNLMNPSDALMYRVLMVNPKFAKNQHEAGILEKEYIIVNEEEAKEIASLLSKKKDKAEDYMYTLKKSKKSMVDALRLLGKNASVDSDKDWLKGELYKIKDEVSTTKGVSGLDKFIAVMEDPRRDIKLFVLDAVEQGEITRDGKIGYKIADSNKFVGRKYEEVVDYFSSPDPEVQEAKLIIQERLKN